MDFAWASPFNVPENYAVTNNVVRILRVQFTLRTKGL